MLNVIANKYGINLVAVAGSKLKKIKIPKREVTHLVIRSLDYQTYKENI